MGTFVWLSLDWQRSHWLKLLLHDNIIDIFIEYSEDDTTRHRKEFSGPEYEWLTRNTEENSPRCGPQTF